MAKRSTRRAREQGRQPAPPPPPPPGRGSRQFWLGVLVAACVLVPLGIVAVLLAGGDESPTPVTASASPTPTPTAVSEQERLQEATQTRDKNQVSDLTALMRRYAEELDPVVVGVDKTLPPGEDGEIGPLASRGEVNEWVRTTREAAAFFEETVSGDTGTNIARGALATAVRGLTRVAETYRLALQRPELRRELLESARAQRDDAIEAWRTAGIQIDVINIAVGFGHQHPPTPGDSSGPPPDELPEGSGSEDGG